MDEEKVLLVSLKKGNRDAFDAVFKKYASRLYFFSMSFFNSKSDAEEIVQETFVRIWETRSTIDENKNFNTYLISIAKNLIYNTFRHKLVVQKYAEQAQQLSDGSYSMEQDLMMQNMREQLLSGIGLLPPQQKEVLLLKSKGYSNEEIAQQLKLSKRTVETHINKAFKYLRDYLADKAVIIALITSCLH